MERITLNIKSSAQIACEELGRDLTRRVAACPTELCPVETVSAFVKLCLSQSCGKCTPCRIGLAAIEAMIDDILDAKGPKDIDLLETTAQAVYDSADCAIGFTAAEMVLKGLKSFKEDFLSHAEKGVCAFVKQKIPCVSGCPAGVDIPGYIALTKSGRYDDAVRLIRKDNPFPLVCGHICEHPCEAHCRRAMVDAPVNIRAIKDYAAKKSTYSQKEDIAPSTGKRIAVIGAGPAGLSAAFYLTRMGHSVTVYEKRKYLGGMLRYGIPCYRLSRSELDRDIEFILSHGITVIHKGIDSKQDFEKLKSEYDSVFIAIGAHTDKKLGIENEDAEGVISAVKMLGEIGDGALPDFKNKNVVIVGGGNVAMDCTRTAKRLGAASATCVYRRRIEDMTALKEEVFGARSEGCELMELAAPLKIETKNGKATALIVQPQIIGAYDRNSRPAPRDAKLPPKRVPADIIVVAIGQNIEFLPFKEAGIEVNRGVIVGGEDCKAKGACGVFVGGDCMTGPATVIKAIEAGKVAASAIDSYLGFEHTISVDIEIPEPDNYSAEKCGRTNMPERAALERAADFEGLEGALTDEQALQEASRCLRCDKYGYGCFKNGRVKEW